MEKLKIKFNKNKVFVYTVNLFFIGVIILGAYTSFFMNLVDRSLWLDEAALTVSFSKRSLFNLTSSSLEWLQTAPAGWLYIAKVATLIFGNTAFVLRMVSVVAYILLVAATYFISARVLKLYYPLAPCAFVASMEFILKYSNVFKPYISDGLFVFLVIIAFYFYDEEKIKYYALAIIWALLVWFSNPVCFYAGGIIVCQGVIVLKKKDWKKFKELIIIGASLVVSFITNYFYWLRHMAENGDMQGYWESNRFPLIPTSMEDIHTIIKLIGKIFIHFGAYSKWALVLVILGLIVAIWKKNKYLISIYVGIVITLFASYIYMFPVEDRMWCFFYPLIILLIFTTADGLVVRDDRVNISVVLMGLLMVCSVLQNDGITHYTKEENVYWENEEINSEIEYLKAHLKEDEAIYVYHHAVPAFQYEVGYDTNSFGGYENNLIFGERFFIPGEDYEEELQKFIHLEKCYIATNHIMYGRLDGLVEATQANGYLELITNVYNTKLYYYYKNPEDTKLDVDMQVVSKEEVEGKVRATIRINNVGEAYLMNGFESAQLVCHELGLSYPINTNVEPKGYIDIPIEYTVTEGITFELQTTYKTIDKITP